MFIIIFMNLVNTKIHVSNFMKISLQIINAFDEVHVNFTKRPKTHILKGISTCTRIK